MVTIDRRPDAPVRRRGRRRRGVGGAGFTLLEMTVVLIIGGVLVAMAALTFSQVNTRGAARRAAQVFSRDLALARSMAVRGREKVVIRFVDDSLRYRIRTASGRELANRQFGPDEDVNLSAIAIGETGDSVVFSNRGIATLGAALGTATFRAGATTYQVTFNGMGASRVGEL